VDGSGSKAMYPAFTRVYSGCLAIFTSCCITVCNCKWQWPLPLFTTPIIHTFYVMDIRGGQGSWYA
jgi:hypothetical protein